MSSNLPEDVHREITKAVMAFAKGKLGEEREALRKLRDSTLLNLSLTSRDVSSVSLPALHRILAISPFNSRLFLLSTTSNANPFSHTRSLTLGTSTSGAKLTKEMQDKFFYNENAASHPDLLKIQEECVRIDEEYSRVCVPGEPVPDAFEKKAKTLQASRTASILSIIIESMPNLQLMESYRWAFFCFVKIKINPVTGTRSSRPLSGLVNLNILKIERSYGDCEMTAANCLWLMLFLPSLTHLKIFTEFWSKDEKFFEDHQEVLIGKSKVTHLDLEFMVKKDPKRLWPGLRITETDILEKLLSATKGLAELKLRNSSIPTVRPAMASSLLFLGSLKSSFNSLKYLSLIGDFTERKMGSEAEDRKRKPPVSINLKSLERISFDWLSIRTLSRPEEDSWIRLDFPSLRDSHFHAGPNLKESPFAAPSIEVTFMNWIKSKSFPTTVKKIILDEKPLDSNGKVIDLGEKGVEWQRERLNLLNLCRTKKLEVQILKVGEQLPFGVMPEPEDLL